MNEEFIEVNKSVNETIQYLCEQSGKCHTSTSNDIQMYFECAKNGKFVVTSSFGHSREGLCPIYHVYGRVISENNKTFVKITSVYKKSDILLRSLLLILIVSLFILKICIEASLYILAIIASFFVLCIVIIDYIKTTSIRKRYALEIVELMENEIKKRVQNIERWDE